MVVLYNFLVSARSKTGGEIHTRVRARETRWTFDAREVTVIVVPISATSFLRTLLRMVFLNTTKFFPQGLTVQGSRS